MRFGELVYSVDGSAATVSFRAGLTVIPVPADERDDWVARLFGVLEGTRAGDGAAEGAELHYSAAHLSLDGRFDWFASIGIDSGAAVKLAVVDSGTFTDEDWDHDAVEAELRETLKLVARAERQLRAGAARCSHVDDLRSRIAVLDSQMDAGLGALAEACQVSAERRAELVDRLDGHERNAQAGEAAALLRHLIEEVEPALVDALAALAAACRPYGVIVDAARIEASGVSPAGITSLVEEALAEVAAGDVKVAERSRLVEELERCEWDLPNVEHLAARHSALQRQVADLEASLRAGYRLPSAGEVETALVDRADRTRRVGRHREALPLVIKAALDRFEADSKRFLLDVVARVADTVQVVYLTDDPDTLAWAAEHASSEPDGSSSVEPIAAVT
jgi:hypothetical protein